MYPPSLTIAWYMAVCPVTFSLFLFFLFPMVVSNLFLWYDEGQDLFSERKKSAVSVSKCFEKEEKTETKMEEET